MNKLFLNLFLISAFGLVLFGCKKKDDPAPSKTPEELAIENLAGESSLTWTVANGGSVTRDGNSETNVYQNFEITFSANANSKTYNTISGGEIFDSSGNWNFVTGDLSKFTLAGTRPASGPEISYTRSTNDLILTFSIVAPGADINIPGAALAGNYKFSLKRKQ
ncbi:hypothetical protein Belba_3721 [Belliella baltica DSM 15883]|uniref:Lipocalin-like domain-containing protein n=1 Tax=Belliella baltica (strain DSM 15883 / CIP 108006 / LMG 21964 / BA134) TaxID=866536 RepID=I3ZAE1_BELBD|nr:hypothetical protein [Belliella baltica]AFL86209.1 hypothetical protein Belba_3721 [Belliella baltica DSM 15883]